MATKVKLYPNISRRECKEVILRNAGRGITTIVRGHNGWGKTALKYDLQEALPKHRAILCDMLTKEAGDMLMPKFVVVDGKEVVRGVTHEELGFHLGGDVIVILDEIFKAKKAMQVGIAQLLYEHKMGVHELSKNSIVCGFSNLEDENFGDSSLGFVYNRVSIVEMRKPTNEEWMDDYAIPKGLHPSITASAKEYPSMFADYRDYSKQGENQYIYDPRQPQPFYVTGRSLERASDMLYSLQGMSQEVITHALINCVGPRAAMDIMGVHELHDQLPEWKEIIAKPDTAKIPDSAGALVLLVYKAIQELQVKQVEPWMVYLKRMKKEAQALFSSTILRIPSKGSVVSSHPAFIKWSTENKYLYQSA